MACARGICTADKIFIFINIGFAEVVDALNEEFVGAAAACGAPPADVCGARTELAARAAQADRSMRLLPFTPDEVAKILLMYSGALLATAARLAWDPSTYTWFRFLCAAQYRASAAYVLAAGLWLAALVWLAAAAAAPAPPPRHPRALHLYAAGVVCLAVSEVGYGAWMAASLAAWWREAPEAELARRGLDLLHDLRPALLAVERYRDVVRPVLDMLDEVEREAPNNAYVIVIFGLVGAALQVAAFVLARRLARRAAPPPDKEAGACVDEPDEPEPAEHEPGWRKKANLRMYTILDKIF